VLPTLKPVTEIKRHATEIIGQLREDRVPVLITEHGKEAAIMLDIGTYKGMMQRLEVLEAIAKGEYAINEGRSSAHADAKARMSKRWAK
jgi:prevent-host-death family protein